MPQFLISVVFAWLKISSYIKDTYIFGIGGQFEPVKSKLNDNDSQFVVQRKVAIGLYYARMSSNPQVTRGTAYSPSSQFESNNPGHVPVSW